MAQLDKLLLRFNQINVGGVPVPVPQVTATQNSPTPPTVLNLASGLAATYNPVTNAIDISAFAAAIVSGQNPNTLSNGLNSNIQTNNLPTVRLAGPSASFSVGGFALPGGGSPAAGQTVVITNTTTQQMTIIHEDLSSTAAYRINTGGLPIVLPGGRQTSLKLVYDGTNSRWVVSDTGFRFDIVINVRDYGATGNGVTDDTTAINNAIAAFQTAAAQSAAAELFFPAGTYAISSELKVTNVTGGIIRGAGTNQTIIQEVSGTTGLIGSLSLLRLINCRQTRVECLHIIGGQHYGNPSGVVNSGASAATITSIVGGGTPIVGQTIAFIKNTYRQCDVVSVESNVGGSLTFSPPLLNSYTGADYIAFGSLSAIMSYCDLTIGGAQVPTNIRFDEIRCGTGIALTSLTGIAGSCKGGGPVQPSGSITAGANSCTFKNAAKMYSGEGLLFADSPYSAITDTLTIQTIVNNTVTFTSNFTHNHPSTAMAISPNDANNDLMVLHKCYVSNCPVAGYYLEGTNALLWRFYSCDVDGRNSTYCAMYSVQGGAAQVFNPWFLCAGWDYVIGGYVQHTWSHFGGATESLEGLLYSDASWNTQNLIFKIQGMDKKLGSGAGVNMINVTATPVNIWFDGANLSIGAPGGITITDPNANATSNFVSQQSQYGSSSLSLTGVYMVDIASIWPIGRTTTLAGGATQTLVNELVGSKLLNTVQVNDPVNFPMQWLTGATTLAQLGQIAAAPGNNILWLAPLPSSSGNFTLAVNSTGVGLNAPAAGGQATIGGGGTQWMYWFQDQMYFRAAAVGGLVSILQQTSNTSTTALIVEGQAAFGAATGGNRNGGDLQLLGGAPAAGGTVGAIDFHTIPTSASAAPGTAAVPASAAGFITVKIGGVAQKIPYYN